MKKKSRKNIRVGHYVASAMFQSFMLFAGGAGDSIFGHKYESKPTKLYKQQNTWHKPHQGEGEKARRRRQMKSGFLTMSSRGLSLSKAEIQKG